MSYKAVEKYLEELVQRAKNGNGQAFMSLVDGMKAQMYRTAYLQLRNEHDALDAVQEALTKAFSGVKKLRDCTLFKTWLIRILINECHNIQKLRSRVFPVDQFSGDGEDPENENREELLQVQWLISSMEPIYREVIDLRYNHDMKIDDIARVLEVPPGTVKSRLNRAHSILRERILEKEE